MKEAGKKNYTGPVSRKVGKLCTAQARWLGYTRRLLADDGGNYVSFDLVHFDWADFGSDCEVSDACAFDAFLDDRAGDYRIDYWGRDFAYPVAAEE
jgi:hypothetical protein